MRRIIVTMWMTLDGFIAGANGEPDCTINPTKIGGQRYAMACRALNAKGLSFVHSTGKKSSKTVQ